MFTGLRGSEAETSDQRQQRYEPDGSWRAPPADWAADTPEALIGIDSIRAVIREALAEMPLPQRVALTLRDVEGRSFKEVCHTREMPGHDVRVLLHLGRRRLWRAIDHCQSARP